MFQLSVFYVKLLKPEPESQALFYMRPTRWVLQKTVLPAPGIGGKSDHSNT